VASEETATQGETGHGAEHEAHSPLEQFEIHPLITEGPNFTLLGFDLSFTNSSLWMVIALGCVYALVMMGSKHGSMVPGRLQSLVEMIYDFIADMIESNAGREGRKYFPFFFTLFTFVLMGNLLGMIPGSFTFTSHIIVTFTMALFVVVSVTVIGIAKHGMHFFSFFVPKGVPAPVLPLLVPIEVLSYLIRPISLSVRLFVNGPPVREHDGRPHHAEDLRRLHHRPRWLLRGARDCPLGIDRGALRPRARDRLPASLCVYCTKLHLSAGGPPPSLGGWPAGLDAGSLRPSTLNVSIQR